MSDDSTFCECGHVADEHEQNDNGRPAECLVCGCVYFEARDDEPEDEGTFDAGRR